MEIVGTEIPSEDGIFCSCIRAVRSFGVNLPKGDAKDLQPNSYPVQGGVVLLTYGDVEHLAYIQFILPAGGMWVQEGNFKKCQYTERFIPWDDEHIRGFWSEDGV